ncbi:hypothetical protein SRHO_G00282350 [Serrasalmus rhombeus]
MRIGILGLTLNTDSPSQWTKPKLYSGQPVHPLSLCPSQACRPTRGPNDPRRHSFQETVLLMAVGDVRDQLASSQ